MNTTSEDTLLALILQNPEWTRQHKAQLSPTLFSSQASKAIFEAVTESGREWDMTSVINVLRQRDKLDAIGGPSTVSEYFTEFPVESMGAYHLQKARHDAELRRTLKVITKAQAALETALSNGTADAPGLLASIRDDIECAGKLPGKRLERLTCAQAMETALNEIEERLKHPGAIPGFSTGFSQLDKLTMGLEPGHLWVIAGKPSDGKSTLMQNILQGAVDAGAKTAIYQLEMSISEQAVRVLVSDAGLCSQSLQMGMLNYAEKAALRASLERLKDSGVDFVNTDGANASDIIADIELSNYDVVMVDYLQLLDIALTKGVTREQGIADITRKLKGLAKRKKLTVLTGSQLNDAGQLRESRAIGQDADKVLFVEPVEVDGEPDESQRDLILAKVRGGPRMKRIRLMFAGCSFRFREAEAEAGADDLANEPDWIDAMEGQRRKARSKTR